MADAKKKDDFGQAEVQSEFDKAQEQGYFGTKVDPLPNSAHSLESGPESPTLREQRDTIAEQRETATKEASK